jgi:hypothetical protein
MMRGSNAASAHIVDDVIFSLNPNDFLCLYLSYDAELCSAQACTMAYG